ncbi:trans-aconitate 2-methyltransferase [Actinopolyspora lacussalsi]|nr:trans-aconitate 2-methyltransferase [Actinopolyspora lacussalsi]
MWNPGTYLAFAEQRERPMRDLLARMLIPSARRVVDLGCGAGNLTPLLTERWPGAEVEALDSSPEMVAAAVRSGVPAEIADIREWMPRSDTDVVVCNAVLHWIPGHLELVERWLSRLPPGACFGMQLPGNFAAPAHRICYQLAAEPEWRSEIGEVPRDPNRVSGPVEYAEALADLDVAIDAWETTYVHRLHGEDPVLAWLAGTALRPIHALLDDHRWRRFTAELAPRLREAYPPRADGSTWLPFRRIFLVAHRN